jgi:hypothetical protein
MESGKWERGVGRKGVVADWGVGFSRRQARFALLSEGGGGAFVQGERGARCSDEVIFGFVRECDGGPSCPARRSMSASAPQPMGFSAPSAMPAMSGGRMYMGAPAFGYVPLCGACACACISAGGHACVWDGGAVCVPPI